MTTLVDAWAELGERAGADAVELVRRLLQAGAAPDEIAEALAVLVGGHNSAAGAVAEALAAEQLAAWGAAAPTDSAAGLAHQLSTDRLRQAAGTVLERLDLADLATLATVEMSAERLARAEAVKAAQARYGSTMASSEDTGGWIRQLEPDACQLCRWWSREGKTWPADHVMPTHTGCTCAQRFVHS